MLVGAGIVPHGSLILNSSEFDLFPGSINLNRAMKSLALLIDNLKPDIIFLTTPHGIQLSKSFGIYINEFGIGSAEWNNKYQEYSTRITISSDFSRNLYKFLDDNDIKIESIISHSEKTPISLKWGEVVPLWFLKELSVEYVIFTIPTRRFDDPRSMIPDLQKLGNLLFNYLDNSLKKVFFLVSGDLSHTHNKDGPYNYSDKGIEFDLLIEKWILTQEKSILINEAANIVNEALSCGFTGFVILQSIIDQLKLKSEVICREVPDYYGMIVANYLKK